MYLKQLSEPYNEHANGTTFKSVVLRISRQTGQTEFDWGSDIVAKSLPPDVKIVDAEYTYYIIYFESIEKANMWLQEFIRLNGK